MAMGALKGQEATLQVAMVCLDELVPEDCGYRKLDRLVDWSFVREAASPYYADELGRPSIDPIVLVKLMVAAALEGVSSARELCRIASLRLDLRRFLGYGFHERLPVHQTLSHAQTRRFVDGQLFERLFLRSLALCREHDLVEGTHFSVDGFHAEANAALASLRASLGSRPRQSRRRLPGRLSSRSPSRARARPRSGAARTRLRSPAPTRTRSCAASPASDPISSTAARWRSTRRRAASSPASARTPGATRATGSTRSSTVPASPAPSLPRSAPTPASPPSASGAAWNGAASSPTSRRSQRCCPRTVSRRARPSSRPPAPAARASRASGRTSGGWQTPRA